MPKSIYFRAFCAFRYGENASFYGYKQKGSYPRGRLPSLTRLFYEKCCMLKATAINFPSLVVFNLFCHDSAIDASIMALAAPKRFSQTLQL